MGAPELTLHHVAHVRQAAELCRNTEPRTDKRLVAPSAAQWDFFSLPLSVAIHVAAIAQLTPNPGRLELALLCRLIIWRLIFIYDLW